MTRMLNNPDMRTQAGIVPQPCGVLSCVDSSRAALRDISLLIT